MRGRHAAAGPEQAVCDAVHSIVKRGGSNSHTSRVPLRWHPPALSRSVAYSPAALAGLRARADAAQAPVKQLREQMLTPLSLHSRALEVLVGRQVCSHDVAEVRLGEGLIIVLLSQVAADACTPPCGSEPAACSSVPAHPGGAHRSRRRALSSAGRLRGPVQCPTAAPE